MEARNDSKKKGVGRIFLGAVLLLFGIYSKLNTGALWYEFAPLLMIFGVVFLFIGLKSKERHRSFRLREDWREKEFRLFNKDFWKLK